MHRQVTGRCQAGAAAQAELASILKDYVGRESPLYHAERLSEHYRRRAALRAVSACPCSGMHSIVAAPHAVPQVPSCAPGRRKDGGRCEIYLKREDLNHTGAHKINNSLGQALLCLRMGKKRIIAETGAGQHGVATATVCARFGLQCIVYMGSKARAIGSCSAGVARSSSAAALSWRHRQAIAACP